MDGMVAETIFHGAWRRRGNPASAVGRRRLGADVLAEEVVFLAIAIASSIGAVSGKRVDAGASGVVIDCL